ncbi:MAG: hypothetical protein O7H40_13620 [Gammaproteobacteria bacterium]|nr:hypothetical protein [Gammaproteobacteria bacterium]
MRTVTQETVVAGEVMPPVDDPVVAERLARLPIDFYITDANEDSAAGVVVLGNFEPDPQGTIRSLETVAVSGNDEDEAFESFIAALSESTVRALNDAPRCLIIVDYLQRMAAGRRDYNDFRHVVTSLVTDLRELAQRLDSPVLCICSQNRPGQDTASLISLKESGDLEYSADTVMFLVSSEINPLPPARAIKLKVAKNRFGDTGAIDLIFKPDIGVMHEERKF